MPLITGTDNADTLIGTSGDDTVIGNAGNDIIDGGGGFDLVAYWTSPFAVVVRLFANIVDNDGFFAQDTLNNISGVAGSGFDDVLYGSDLGNYMQGLTGNDSIFGLGGDDLIRAGEGNDEVDGGAGTDQMYFFGARSEYTVSTVAGGIFIVDSVADRDGTDTVLNVERFQFNNTLILAADILDPSATGNGIPYPPPAGPPPVAGGFGSVQLKLSGFGAGSGAGGWASDTRYPRHVADVNGDGQADIVGFGEAGAFVSLADGSGGFGTMSLRFAGFGAGSGAGGWTNDERYPRHVADVNGDGRADLVGFGEAGAWVALADGSGGFGSMALRFAGFGAGQGAGGWTNDERYPRHVADVNGDGRADLVGFGEEGAWVALADGSGGFGSMALRFAGFGAGPGAGGWTNDDHYPRHVVDVNGDGRADLVGFGEAGVFVALADASGNFGSTQLRLGAFGAGVGAGGWTSDNRYPRHLADVNGDGRADIVGFGEAGVFVALADGTGSFGATTLRLAALGAGPGAGGWTNDDRYPRHLADVNDDGRADIVGFGQDGVLVALSDNVWS